MYKVNITSSAERTLRRLDRPVKNRIVIADVENNPNLIEWYLRSAHSAWCAEMALRREHE
jgi:mRNA-degrading endonuclease RelE of RelBE toxin-antitoxin system